jgi:hypothetical protein
LLQLVQRPVTQACSGCSPASEKKRLR